MAEIVSPAEGSPRFAAQALACLDSWPALDPDIVNPNRGAVALGHRIGCSGARTSAPGPGAAPARRPMGLAASCIGVGQGLAVVLAA